jgi:ribonuclease J
LKVIPLGGVDEFGKNMTIIEYEDEIIVIDCGLMFPDEEMLGVDIVIPDITYLKNNKDKIKGVFLTHGHEGHIGAIPYLLKEINVPVYSTKLTIALVKNKLKEHKILSKSKLNIVEPEKIIKFQNFKIEFIKNSHSIPDSCAIAIYTPVGTVLHTGDFKIDYTPTYEKKMDINKIVELGKKRLLLLLADSTNVEKQGYSLSESVEEEVFDKIFYNAKGRVIVANFAANIQRMQQIINTSVKYNRKVAITGKSLEVIADTCIELGYIKIPKENLINIDEERNYPDNEITIITTGNQGEPMSVLYKIASSVHKKIQVKKGDLVVISSAPVPGNEKFISKVINELYKKGASVIYKELEKIHESGHASVEELKLLHTLLKPKFFVPIHGEYRHLKLHAKLAEKLGMNKSKIFILDTGQTLELSNKSAKKAKRVPSGKILVDGLGVGDVGNIVLRDRRFLSREGILTVVITIEKESFNVLAGPDIVSRGFVYIRESEELMLESKEIVKKSLNRCLDNNITEWAVIKSNIKNDLKDFLYSKTKRKPIILSIIMEI